MSDFERQLRRQSLWLKDSIQWILKDKVIADYEGAGKPSALDIGCGPGFVMEQISSLLGVVGIDKDQDMVTSCKARNLRAFRANAEELPFDDSSFDIVYCSFLFLWLKNPNRVLGEMKRVSRNWIICFAEPDYGARIDYPRELSPVRDIIAEGIVKEGGDPFIGRKLRSIFNESGLEAEIGVHPGIWDINRLRQETDEEWRWINEAGEDFKTLSRLRRDWEASLEDGSLFEFNPIFYALARKSSKPEMLP